MWVEQLMELPWRPLKLSAWAPVLHFLELVLVAEMRCVHLLWAEVSVLAALVLGHRSWKKAPLEPTLE